MKKNIKPLFIFCLPRSGSTLLQKLLMTHEEIFSVTEPWLLLPFLGIIREEGTLAEYSHLTMFRAIRDFLETMGGEEEFYKILHNFVLDLYGSSIRFNKSKAVYFLDKTPRYYLIIPQILKLFPQAKFIFLFREPLAIFASMVKTWHRNRLKLHFNYVDLFEGPQFLAAGYRLLQERALKINYEDLVKNPSVELQKVGGYLEIDPAGFDLVDYKKQELKGELGDHTGIKKYRTVSRESVENWKRSFDNYYRKRVLKNYLHTVDDDYLELSGFDREYLMSEIEKLKVRGIGLRDIRDNVASNIYRKLKLMSQCSKVKSFYKDWKNMKSLYY